MLEEDAQGIAAGTPRKGGAGGIHADDGGEHQQEDHDPDDAVSSQVFGQEVGEPARHLRGSGRRS